MSEPEGSPEPAEPRTGDSHWDKLRVGVVNPAESDKLNLKLWEKCDNKNIGEVDLSDTEIQSVLDSIFSEDFATRQITIDRLNKAGDIVAKYLVNTLVNNTTNETLVFQITYALEIIGKPAVAPLIEALKQINELKNPVTLDLLENIVETLIRIDDKSAAQILIQHIRNITAELQKLEANGLQGQNSSRRKIDFYQSARMTIHRLLGELGSNEGLDDLLLLLGDGTKRVHEDVLETITRIGNRKALLPLIRLYSVEANISEYGTRHIKAACRDIMRREKIAPSDKLFQQLPQQEKEALKNILYRNRKNAGNGNND